MVVKFVRKTQNRTGKQMKINEILGKRYKEKPNDAKLKSHELLLRGGYIRPVSSGIFSVLMPGLRVLKNIENIVRQEINNVGGQEVEMPLVQPKELWQESGRYEAINDELVRFKDRNDHDNVLAMTHEEAAVALARTEATSYKDYPFSIYQFAKKFRDEARPRGGLVRVKEFTMKDAYSFHRDLDSLNKTYLEYAIAYDRIFARAGIPEVISIQSDSGMMGGKIAHEYMLLTPSGEDTIITCDKCGYKANKEVAVSKIAVKNGTEEMLALEKVHTPDIKTIEDLAKHFGIETYRMAKAVVYKNPTTNQAVIVMIRGDREVNENKLAKILQFVPEFADDAVFAASGIVPGFASAYGAKNAIVVVDESLRNERNLITGANERDYHIKNFNVERDLPDAKFADVASVMDGDTCAICGAPIKVNRGIEVGNIFQLGDKYTTPMKMTYTDENGTLQTPIMGCYGIGIGRLMASVIEAKHDDRGPIWPVSIAPWVVSVTALASKNPEIDTVKIAGDLYEQLQKAGLSVLLDDRETSAGEKFADIDLLGVPLQLVASQKTLEQNKIEVKVRETGEKTLIDLDKVVAYAIDWVRAENEKLMNIAANVKGLDTSFIKK